MFVQYERHGRVVWVDEMQKGLHKDVCLCYSCSRFKPDHKENCRIAKELYALCVKENLVTPVLECPLFEEDDDIPAMEELHGGPF
jgi:hypothetical protein